MIDDALRFLENQAVNGSAPKTVFETRKLKTFLLPGGEVHAFNKEAPSRCHGVETLADICALANRFQEEGEAPVVWFDDASIVLVINDNDHRDETATVELVKSGLYKAIAALDPRTWYAPKEFIRLLRVDLYGALEPQILLNSVRKVQFEAGATVRVENKRASESMGKEISASVSAASELPEYVSLLTPMFVNAGVETMVSIKAAVEVDPNRQAFQLVVLPDELEKAKAHVMRALSDTLGNLLNPEIPAYQGQPDIV